MKRKEMVKIMQPYWLNYLRNNGEFERKLQLEKFVINYEFCQKLNFIAFLHIDKYIAFKVASYSTRKEFWKFTKDLVKLKKMESEWDSLREKYKGYYTEADIKKIDESKAKTTKKFKDALNIYFKNTLGASDRELRLWSAYEVIRIIAKQ